MGIGQPSNLKHISSSESKSGVFFWLLHHAAHPPWEGFGEDKGSSYHTSGSLTSPFQGDEPLSVRHTGLALCAEREHRPSLSLFGGQFSQAIDLVQIRIAQDLGLIALNKAK